LCWVCGARRLGGNKAGEDFLWYGRLWIDAIQVRLHCEEEQAAMQENNQGKYGKTWCGYFAWQRAMGLEMCKGRRGEHDWSGGQCVLRTKAGRFAGVFEAFSENRLCADVALAAAGSHIQFAAQFGHCRKTVIDRPTDFLFRNVVADANDH